MGNSILLSVTMKLLYGELGKMFLPMRAKNGFIYARTFYKCITEKCELYNLLISFK